MEDGHLSFGTRLWFAFAFFWRVLFDGAFAARAFAVRAALPPRAPQEDEASEDRRPAGRDPRSALQLLSLLQREGRFVDFIQQEIEGFSDADVAAAARLVHHGCRKAVSEHLQLETVQREAEGATVTVPAEYDANHVKLTGNVAGTGPYSGIVRHRGWRVRTIELPELVGGHDAAVLAPAEIEL